MSRRFTLMFVLLTLASLVLAACGGAATPDPGPGCPAGGSDRGPEPTKAPEPTAVPEPTAAPTEAPAAPAATLRSGPTTPAPCLAGSCA